MSDSTANNAPVSSPVDQTEWIKSRVKHAASHVTPRVPDGPLEDEIFRLLMSKHYRKYSTNPEYLTHIRGAIRVCMEKREPVKLVLVFGGYKLWRLPEAPEPDWAELFALMYYAQWLAPIAAVYRPGVWLDFYSDDVILEEMDNIPQRDTLRYLEGFRSILSYMAPYLPGNLRFTLTRVGDQYASYAEFLSELTKNRHALLEKFGGLPALTPEQRELVELNVRLAPGQDTDPSWREKVFLTHEAYAIASKRRPYYRRQDTIFVSSRKMKDSLAVGTTKRSVVKFWIGAGVLERVGDGYAENIYSPSQLERSKTVREPIHVPGLTGKNYHSIRMTAK